MRIVILLLSIAVCAVGHPLDSAARRPSSPPDTPWGPRPLVKSKIIVKPMHRSRALMNADTGTADAPAANAVAEATDVPLLRSEAEPMVRVSHTGKKSTEGTDKIDTVVPSKKTIHGSRPLVLGDAVIALAGADNERHPVRQKRD
ncbi:hypothetical protein HGRIS_008110 [Hohenbuehelia grisea]|uniref:Uncharacterized protein n=1 Tax=Hohenbuehelia grisea TaxID=104357 RepID=A0ABR3J7D5_9AGAR